MAVTSPCVGAVRGECTSVGRWGRSWTCGGRCIGGCGNGSLNCNGSHLFNLCVHGLRSIMDRWESLSSILVGPEVISTIGACTAVLVSSNEVAIHDPMILEEPRGRVLGLRVVLGQDSDKRHSKYLRGDGIALFLPIAALPCPRHWRIVFWTGSMHSCACSRRLSAKTSDHMCRVKPCNLRRKWHCHVAYWATIVRAINWHQQYTM